MVPMAPSHYGRSVGFLLLWPADRYPGRPNVGASCWPQDCLLGRTFAGMPDRNTDILYRRGADSAPHYVVGRSRQCSALQFLHLRTGDDPWNTIRHIVGRLGGDKASTACSPPHA